MKIAVFSDVHADLKYGDVPREGDIASTIETLIAGIEKARPDRVMILGDVYDSPSPSVAAVRQVVAMVSRLAVVAPVTVLQGNHDAAERDDLHDGLAVLEAMGNERVNVIREMRMMRYAAGMDSGGIYHVPHLPRWTDVDGDVNARIREGVADALASGCRLFAGHLNVVGAKMGAADVYERGHSGSRKPTWPVDLLRGATVHIPGSLIRMGFSEAGDEKGYLLIDTAALTGTHIVNGHYHCSSSWVIA